MKNQQTYAFSLFRISVGLSMLLSGMDKIISEWIVPHFSPAGFSTLQYFLTIFSVNAKLSVFAHFLMPTWMLYFLSYLTPLLETSAGVLLTLGYRRTWGVNLGILQMAIFICGSTLGHQVGGMHDVVLRSMVWTIALFMIYIQVQSQSDDPLSLDRWNRVK